jgi:hypothetical protein|tara:strand:+ start:1398 stop:1505 length:108 start_codon:yes stop_codon:yes gene_type:complete
MEKLMWIKDKVMAMPKHKQIALAIAVVAVVIIVCF